jgi:hypothetical protein
MRDKIKDSAKKVAALALVVLMVFGWSTPVLAESSPYRGYTYNHWAALVPSPAAYTPLRSFMAENICESLIRFIDPRDLHICPEGYFYLTDTGNNRIVIFTEELELVRVINGFYENGEWQTFNMPSGVFVTWEREIFVADTNGLRIPVLDWYGNHLYSLYGPSEYDDVFDGFLFRPLDILVDRGGRIYVNVHGVYEGLMNFNSDGVFLGYFGTITTWLSPLDLFWRYFMTETQRGHQRRVIPTVFQSISIDENNFVFTTNIQAWGSNQIMRLNPQGSNVLINMNSNVAINGDQLFRTAGGGLGGPSQFVDVIARSHGMYSALDTTRGRVYTYDREGNLLYVFSGTGHMEGMMRRPVSLDVLGEDIYVLDANQGRVVHFIPTEYGALINHAIAMRYIGDEDSAIKAWRELVAIDEHFQLAWAGIGRGMLAAGDNVAAMYYLRRGMDMMHYSIAFRRNRMDVMQTVLPRVFLGGTIALALAAAVKIGLVIRKRVAAE